MGLKLVGEVALDGSGFERGMARMASSVKGLVVSAFGIYGVEAALTKTMETAGQLVDSSQRLGVGVEQLQVLGQAAKNAGADMGAVTKGFERIDIARAKALSGSKEGQKLLGRFAQLGISPEDLKTKSAADLFTGPMAKKAQGMNPEELGPILKDILGKGFGELLPMLGTDFVDLEGKMRALGSIMDTDVAVRLDTLGDEFSMLGNILAVKLGPVILSLAEVIYKVIGGLASIWAAFKAGVNALFTDQAGKKMQRTMAITPGYGGYTEEQKRQIAAQKAEDEKNGAKPEMSAMDRFKAAANTAMDAGGEEAGSWDKYLKGLKAKMAEDAEKLKKPVKATFTSDSAEEKEQKQNRKFLADRPADSLVSVGNFLGSSKSVMEDLGRKQVDLLQRIVENTTPAPAASSGSGSDDFDMV